MGLRDSSKGPLLLRVLRVVQAILALIVLGLAAYVAHWWSNHWNVNSPHSFNFLVFCSVWTLLALLYLTVVPWRFENTRAHHRFAGLGVDAVTMIFWFSGFVAVAVFISNRSCFGGVCSAAKAAAVFGAFAWLTFAITSALAALSLRSAKSVGTHETDTNMNAQSRV